MYTIQFYKRFVKDLELINNNDRDKIKKAIEKLKENPRPNGYKKLKGNSNPSLFRIRVGDYRIIYTIDDGKLLVILIEIGHRRDIYD